MSRFQKIISILLAVTLSIHCLPIPAFAETFNNDVQSEPEIDLSTYDLEQAGNNDESEYQPEEGINNTRFYSSSDVDELASVQNGNNTDRDSTNNINSISNIGSLPQGQNEFINDHDYLQEYADEQAELKAEEDIQPRIAPMIAVLPLLYELTIALGSACAVGVVSEYIGQMSEETVNELRGKEDPVPQLILQNTLENRAFNQGKITLSNAISGSHTYETKTINVLAFIHNAIVAQEKIQRDVSYIQANTLIDGSSSGTYTLAQIAGFNYNKLYNILQKLTGLGKVLDNQVSIGSILDGIRSETRNTNSRLETSYKMTGVTSGTYGVGIIAALIHNRVASIDQTTSQNNSLLSAGFTRLVTNRKMLHVAEGSYSVAQVTALIHDKLIGDYNLSGQGTGAYTIVGLNALMHNLLYDQKTILAQTNNLTSAGFARLVTTTDMTGVTSGTYSAAQVLGIIQNRLVGEYTLASRGKGTYSVAALLAILNDELYSLNNTESSTNSLLSTGLDRIRSRIETTWKMSGVSAGTYGVGYIAAFIHNLVYDIKGLQTQNNSLLSKGFADLINEYANPEVTVKVEGIEIGEISFPELEDTNDKLDELIRLQKQAMTADLLKALIGDGEMNKIVEATAAVEQAVTNAFPFCIPALLKQILGLMNTEAKAPEIHYVIWGASLDVYFDDFKSLADITCWLSRIFFIISLLTVTRRFIFAGETAL